MEATSRDRDDAFQCREGPLARAVGVVRVLAAAGRPGVPLSTLAQEVGLPLSTVHRLLTQLLAERLAMQIEGEKRYAIGPLAYELGLVAAQQFDIRELCRPAMERLAAESSETVYLLQRSGNEAVCLDLKQGPTTVRVVTLRIGSRRPLGLGAGGLAILAALPKTEGDEVLAVVAKSIERTWRFPSAVLRQSLEEAREQGFAVIRNRITAGVTAIGRSFDDSLGQVFGAVTIAGLNARMTASRMESHGERLRTAALTIERALCGERWARYATRL
jgi:DNA-binding IclR family transcriptional regulator